MDKKPADITLEQLGGSRRLKAMIGADKFFSDDNGATLCFKFKASKKANFVRISLNSMDLYDLKFQKVGIYRPGALYEHMVKDVGEFEGIYAEDLKSVIESFTGLSLSI